MCYSAAARPPCGVVVGRAVFVPWSPPTTIRSRTRTGFVFCCFHFATLHDCKQTLQCWCMPKGYRRDGYNCSDVLARVFTVPRQPPSESSAVMSGPHGWQWQIRSGRLDLLGKASRRSVIPAAAWCGRPTV